MLVSKSFVEKYGRQLDEVVQRVKLTPEILHLPDDPQGRLAQSDCDRIEVTMQSRDIRFSDHFKSFGDALIAAKNLQWAHFHSTAIEQHVFVAPLLARGVRLTTSAGTNAEPVAHTAIGGLLMLARKFPHWLAAQQRHAWEPLRGAEMPADLRGQTIAIVGLGNIGMAAAPAHLNNGGVLAVEHGYDQAPRCRELLAAAGLEEVFSRTDIAGIERVSGGVWLGQC